MRFLELKNKWFIWPLFLFLFGYIILRAWFVQPILDELGTLYWYIQTGQVIGGSAVMDTNNHFLNTFVAKWMYGLFGDHFFGFRLLAMASFPIYFFSTKTFIQRSIDKNFAWIIFIAINTVPWITDYFSLCRGYGPSLAFFLAAFCLFQTWIRKQNWKLFGCFIALLIITLFSNLSLLVPTFILFSYSIFLFVINRKKIEGKLPSLLFILAFMAFLVPVYIYLNKLKKAGALWWGSRDGLWEVTGKSLARNTLFTEHEIWKYIFIALFVLLSVLLILALLKHKLTDLIQKELFWVTAIFAGSLLSAILMAVFLQVNYPMDRVGMYLVPLFILVIGLLFSQNRYLRWLLLALIWFPVSFVWKLNLMTSVFSPEDRIHTEFYTSIKEIIKDDKFCSSDYVMHVIYAYSSRKDKVQHLLSEFNGDTTALGEYHLSWLGGAPSTNYEPVLKDRITATTLFKRKTPFNRVFIKDTLISYINSRDFSITLCELNLDGKYKNIQADVSSSVQVDKPILNTNLSYELFEKDSVSSYFQGTRFDCYFGGKTKYKFRMVSQPYVIKPNDKKFVVFMRNNTKEHVVMRNVRVKLFGVSY